MESRFAHQPESVQVTVPVQVTGSLVTGHTRAGDNDAPIYVDPAEVITPGAALLADARCKRCTARVTVARGDDGTLLLIEHRPGCARLAALARRAGAGS